MSQMHRRKLLTALTGVTSATIAGCINTGSRGDSDPGTKTSSETSEENQVQVNNLDNTEEPKLGNKSAPVTLIYWGDFNCMYCYQFAQQTFPRLEENFVSAGDLRVVYKNFIAMGEDSFKLAKASQAAWKMVGTQRPETYWEWHEELSADQKRRKESSQSVIENIEDTTRKVEGIRAEQLRETMKNVADAEIDGDMQEGKQRGISGTPSFVVHESGSTYGTRIIGAKPYSEFETEISRRL